MSAVSVHHTATSDATWDGSAAEKNLGTDYTVADLKDVFAWVPSGSDPNKADCVFPHHFVAADGKPGAASTEACSAVVGSLNGARGGSSIPEGDRQGVYNHVIAHLKDSGVKEADLPELKSRLDPRHESRILTPLNVLREHRSAMALKGTRSRHTQVRPRAEFDFRARPDGTGGTVYSFNGYAAAFDAGFEMWDAWGDPYTEELAAGACNRTLANGCDTQFLIGHNEGSIPLARTKSGTMTLASDSHGLEVIVPSLDGRSPMVQSLASAMERGDMDEMSIGFIATQQQWSPDWMTRRITEINLNRGDVSMVCWAANPAANGASMTALPVSEAAARGPAGRESRTPTAPYSAKDGESNLCPQCKSMNSGTAAYCDQCGTAIRSDGSGTADENLTQRCPCGVWNADDAKFCSDCGQNLASDQDADNGGYGNGNAEYPGGGYWSQQNPGAERRASADLGLTGDPEVGFSDSAPEYDPSQHGPGSPTCPSCSAANGLDAKFCDQCGAGLYDNDALIADPLSWAMQARVRVLALRR